jgi:hypothetical protein
MPERMDAAVRVDAQNAPTRTWKTAQTAVSHSAHTHHRVEEMKEQEDTEHPRRQPASHTKFLTLPAKATFRISTNGDPIPISIRWRMV